MSHKSVFNWSGGKDSAMALYRVMQDPAYEVGTLLTTINKEQDRIVMHGVRQELLDQQASLIGLDLKKIMLSPHPDTSEYNKQMQQALDVFKAQGYTHAVFGDIFLEDLRAYREERLDQAGFKSVFPLWKEDTAELMQAFIEMGFKTVVVCVNGSVLDESFAGRVIDASFLRDLPSNVDPCGENGEFHTFVFDGPIFKAPVKFKKGELIYKTYPSPNAKDGEDPGMGFYFCDLLPQ